MPENPEKLNLSLPIFSLLIFYLILSVSTDELVLTIEILQKSLENSNLPSERINEILTIRKTHDSSYILSKLVSAFMPFLQIILISLFIKGVAQLDKIQDISFGKIFNIVCLAQLVFVLSDLSKILIFCFFKQDYFVKDFQNFAPFSISNLMNENTPNYIKNLCRYLNIFELIYIILLTINFKKIATKPFNYSLNIILIAYLLPLIFFVFITSTLEYMFS